MQMTIDDMTKLIIPENFGCDEDGYGEMLEDFAEQFPCEYAYGISKFVIFMNDEYVAKIPFNGEWFYSDDEEDYVFDTFTVVDDYCAEEAYIYDCAKNRGIEEFFAETKFAGYTKDHTPFYLSERINKTLDESWDDVRDVDTTSAREYVRSDKGSGLRDRRLSDRWLAVALEKYGQEKVDKFAEFIEEFDINDLHCANVGFRKDGSPVLIDYSGWRGEF